jgi:hypothetical protein
VDETGAGRNGGTERQQGDETAGEDGGRLLCGERDARASGSPKRVHMHTDAQTYARTQPFSLVLLVAH